MIVEQIYEYLNSEKKELNEELLKISCERFGKILTRQLMKDREDRKGHEYATLYTKGCARQSAYKFHAIKGEVLQPRAKINFLCGDIVELAALALAEISGAKIEYNNKRLEYKAHGDEIAVKPDGLISFEDELYNVEIKKMNERVFDRVMEEGLDDLFGYRTQVMLEVAGWRNEGLTVDKTVFLMLRGLTGHLGEIVIPYEKELVDKANWRRHLVVESTPEELPPRAYEPEPEQEYIRKGKKGWVPTGRSIIGLQCSYCDHKSNCWPEAQLDTIKGKPVWVLPKKKVK